MRKPSPTLPKPDKKEYWIEAVVFDGDPYLDEDHLGGETQEEVPGSWR